MNSVHLPLQRGKPAEPTAAAPMPPPAAASETADLRWLSHIIAGHKRAVVGALIAGILAGFTTALEPFFIGMIIDDVNAGSGMDVIWRDVALLILFGVFTVIAFFGQRYYSGEIAYGVNYDLRGTLFGRLLRQDRSFYDHYATGDLISRVNSDTEMVWRLMALFFLRFASSLTLLVFTFTLLALVDIRLTAVVFVVLAISTAFQVGAGSAIVDLFERVQAQAGRMASFVQDSISGVLTIKTFGREEGASQAFARENAEYRRIWLRFKRRNEPVGMLPNMISQLTTGIVVLFGGILTVQGELTLGNFTQFLLYLGLISSALLHLGTIYQRLQQARGALTRLTPILQLPGVRSPDNAIIAVPPHAEIVFEHVSLTLDGTRVLDDVSLRIPPRKTVAFVGATGSGKTLLLNLLARVHDATEGSVRVGGHDVREYDLDALRSAIAYVPQETFLFSETLAANIRMGVNDLEAEALGWSAEMSRLANDLPQLPHGLDTLVGEKGVMVSGGQRQRIAIARALIRKAQILVLDDALSSVDTHTSADILRNLRTVLHERTSLIVAHRIATVKDADFIVVMEGGRIVEQGSHGDLVLAGGTYAAMVQRELRRDDDPPLAR
ncbi:MAG: ABC transporter ATP-binding protein [Anaerolineae bacterium]|nr:ABC transporter ATP-binding protein [Anaerolineae bacterium]